MDETLAAIDAAFIERMKNLSDDAASKSKEIIQQSEVMTGKFVERFTHFLTNPIKIEPINERSGNPADSPKAA